MFVLRLDSIRLDFIRLDSIIGLGAYSVYKDFDHRWYCGWFVLRRYIAGTVDGTFIVDTVEDTKKKEHPYEGFMKGFWGGNEIQL